MYSLHFLLVRGKTELLNEYSWLSSSLFYVDELLCLLQLSLEMGLLSVKSETVVIY